MKRLYIIGGLVAVALLILFGASKLQDFLASKQSIESPNTSEEQSTTTLDLSSQGLTAIPSYVFDMEKLEGLNISGNSLKGALPSEVGKLQNLKVLNISGNEFTGIPAEVGQLTNLEVLDVSNNQITGLPYEIGNLQNLIVFNLTGNTYAEADLAVIKESLSSTTQILID